MTIKTAIKCTPKFKKWWKKSQKSQKILVVNAVRKLAKEVKEGSTGRPTIGRAKMLKGFQAPIYEIRVEKDLRLLYHTKISISEKNLLICDVLDHDHLNRGAKQSVEHLVHAKKLDQVHWDDDDEVTGIFELEPFKDGNGNIIGKFEYDSLDEGIKNKYQKIPKEELVANFDDWVNEKAKYYTKDDYWSEKIYDKAVDDACIWQFLDDKEIDEIYNEDEWKNKLVEEGEWTSKISLKPEQKELIGINEQVFILEGVAGTGKTTILEERFLIFIRNNEWKGKVLFLTHNKELSKSVKSRLKNRVKKIDYEYIDLAVIDVESWYRSIEFKYLEKIHFEQINIKIEENNAKLIKLNDEFLDCNNEIIKLEKNIHKERVKVKLNRKALKDAKEVSDKLSSNRNSAKNKVTQFDKEIKKKNGLLHKFTDSEKKLRNDLALNYKKADKEYYSNESSMKKHKRNIKISEDILKEAKRRKILFEEKLSEISTTNPGKIKSLENQIKNLKLKLEQPFSERQYRDLTQFVTNKQITYDIFANLNQGKGRDTNDQGVLWEEYRGVILGHGINFLKTGGNFQLSRDEYLEISRDRGLSNKNQETRPKVWDEINSFAIKREKYGEKFSKREGGWIDQEQAKFTQKLLEDNKTKYQAIFIDEVQDLTELQIAIMLNLLEGMKKFEVAGDTSQSVYPSAFRWEDLRLQIHKKLEPKKFPEHYRMDINYRSTPYLVESANLILDEHKDVMGEKRTTIRQRTDRLEKGTHPSIVRLSEKELIKNLKELKLPNVFCPLLVRDNTIIGKIAKELATDEQKVDNESNPNVMSIPECKGLEYENVIIWDPCSGSNRLLDDFYHHKKGNSITDSDATSLELRYLFVGITRSRYRLSLIGPGDEETERDIVSGLGYFESKNEFSIEGKEILKDFTKKDASSDDFIERAREFEQRGKFQLAADAYRSAGLSNERNRCMGMHFLSSNEHLRASEHFEISANETDDLQIQKMLFTEANKCLDIVIEENSGVEILERKARLCSYIGDELGGKRIDAYRFEQLGLSNNNKRKTFLKKSAELFSEIGHFEDALRIYKMINDYFKITKITMEIGNEKEFFISLENWLKTEKKYYPILYSIFSGEDKWKERVSTVLEVGIEDLPNSTRDELKQEKYANAKQKAKLELKRAKNWNERVQAYKKMGKIATAANILVENDQDLLALNLLLKENNEDYYLAITELLALLKQDKGLEYLFQYYVEGKVPEKSEVAFEERFPRNNINEWMKYMKKYKQIDNLMKHPVLSTVFISNIFHRDLFSSKSHPLSKSFKGLADINTILLQDLIRDLTINGYSDSKFREKIILLSFYYLKANNDMQKNEKLINYQYFAVYTFIDSIISLENVLISCDTIGDDELYMILTQTFASITKNLENIDLIKSFYEGKKIEKGGWEDAILMILFFYSLFSTVIGKKILNWKKSFGFIHYLYIFACSMIYESEGGEVSKFNTKYSLNIKKAIAGLDNRISSRNNQLLLTIDKRLNIRGIDCSAKYRNHGQLISIDIRDSEELATEKISINYECTKNLLRNIEDQDIKIHNGSWLEKTCEEFLSKEEKIDYIENDLNVLDNIEDSGEEMIEHNQIELEILEQNTDKENLDEGLILENYEEIINIEIELSNNDEDEDNEDVIVSIFPFYEAVDAEDPYEIFKKTGIELIRESNNQMSDFRQIMWDWKHEINRRWLETQNSYEKIVLISANQCLIDMNKELDEIGKFPISISEKREHGRRAKSVQKELYKRRYKWANRAIMS